MGQTIALAREARAKKKRADLRDDRRRKRLAYWYESLARCLLHEGPISFRRWQWESVQIRASFDLDVVGLAAYVEVKGAGNTDRIKIFSDQLQRQQEELGFPVDRGFLLLFGYRNRRRRDGRRLLKRTAKNSRGEMGAFLAKNTLKAYAVDMGLLKALGVQKGTWTYGRDRYAPREILRICRRDFERIACNARGSLAELGYGEEDIRRWLPPGAVAIRTRRIEAEFDGRHVEFQLFPLLPNGFKTKLLRTLNGTVRCEEVP